VEEHNVTVRIEDGLYFRLAAVSSSPVLQQEVRASGELVDVNTLKGDNLKISGVEGEKQLPQAVFQILDSSFVTSFGLFIFEKRCKCTFKN
jgi:hypothetical protein